LAQARLCEGMRVIARHAIDLNIRGFPSRSYARVIYFRMLPRS
jgi:hypothetical protein